MAIYFTLKDANRSLLIVAPIVSDILRKMREAERLHEAVKKEKLQKQVSEQNLLEQLTKGEKLINEVEYHLKELEAVGPMLADIQLGIVDFPCMYENRVVYLCWVLGEESVSFWHEVDQTFTTRKLVTARFEEHITI